MAKATAQEIATDKYTSGSYQPVIDKCDGCERIIDVESAKYCKAYSMPEAKWRLGICNFATHAKPEIVVNQVKVNPLKASKRAAGK